MLHKSVAYIKKYGTFKLYFLHVKSCQFTHICISLGLGHYDNQFTPSLVKGDIENEKIVQLSCAADCVLAVSGIVLIYFICIYIYLYFSLIY